MSSLAIPRWCAATRTGTAKRRRAPGPTGSRMLPRHRPSKSLHPRRDDPRQHCVVHSSAYGVVCAPRVRCPNLRKTLCLFSTMLRPHLLYSFRLRAVRGSAQGSSRWANGGVSLHSMLQCLKRCTCSCVQVCGERHQDERALRSRVAEMVAGQNAGVLGLTADRGEAVGAFQPCVVAVTKYPL